MTLRILSLGAGVQSSTMALMAAHGEIDMPDSAIFADVGWEPRAVYEWLDWLEPRLPFPLHRVSKGNIRDNLIQKATLKEGEPGRFVSIPFFVSGGGLVRRQCTHEFKLQPLWKKTRELLGYQPRQRIPEGSAEMLIGISLDEAHRMKPSTERWITNRWPLIEKRMTRADCLAWMERHGYPQPPKSSCLGCPFHSDRQWLEIKAVPEEWADVVEMDRIIRDGGRKMRESQFMHRSLKPIDQVDFSALESTIDMFGNECDGICNT